MIRSTILAASALTLGLGLGYLAADGQPDVQTQTVTKEVPVVHTKEVEVPGPVRWRTRTVQQTKVHKVYSTPSSCLSAINAAEEIRRQSGTFAKTAAQYPPLVAEAYKAGVLQDAGAAHDIAARMRGLTGRIRNLSLDEAYEVFEVASSSCRSF